MADIESERSSTGLAFIVGGLVVAVLLIGYFLLSGNTTSTRDVDVDVTVPAPAVPAEPAPPANATPPASGSTTQ
ncbi:MAG TPA: hypothetical protein VMT98_09780 [Verrucomicrobiae bacterium]|jgi:hypothetical protein|nr:hypothetical protein [Verrucomicrobiae bacterium]